MSIWIILLTAVHVMVCIFLVIVVLIQSGKGADLAGAFGGASQTAFGPRGAANWASRATTTAAILFMITSLSLSILQSHKTSGSAVTDKMKDEPKQEQKNTPPPPAPVVDQKPDAKAPAAAPKK